MSHAGHLFSPQENNEMLDLYKALVVYHFLYLIPASLRETCQQYRYLKKPLFISESTAARSPREVCYMTS